MGKLFGKTPSVANNAPAAAPAPVADGAAQKEDTDTSKKKKKQGKASLLVDDTGISNGAGNTGINL